MCRAQTSSWHAPHLDPPASVPAQSGGPPRPPIRISLGELVRRALTRMLDETERVADRDAFSADGATHSGEVPPGASVHHDRHLHPKRDRWSSSTPAPSWRALRSATSTTRRPSPGSCAWNESRALRSRASTRSTKGITLLARWAGASFADDRGRALFASRAFRILRPTAAHDVEGLAELEPFAAQPISHPDAISFVLMRDAGVSDAFAFDRRFRPGGFSLWPEGSA